MQIIGRVGGGGERAGGRPRPTPSYGPVLYLYYICIIFVIIVLCFAYVLKKVKTITNMSAESEDTLSRKKLTDEEKFDLIRIFFETLRILVH